MSEQYLRQRTRQAQHILCQLIGVEFAVKGFDETSQHAFRRIKNAWLAANAPCIVAEIEDYDSPVILSFEEAFDLTTVKKGSP